MSNVCHVCVVVEYFRLPLMADTGYLTLSNCRIVYSLQVIKCNNDLFTNKYFIYFSDKGNFDVDHSAV